MQAESTSIPANDQSEAPTLAQVQSQLSTAQAELAESRKLIEQAAIEQTHARVAFDAGAIDLDAVVGLIKSAAAQKPDLDAVETVKRLRSLKPHLFRTGHRWPLRAMTVTAKARGPAREPMDASHCASTTVGAMGSRTDPDHAANLAHAARHATNSGDRGSLLSYLRLRRSFS